MSETALRDHLVSFLKGGHAHMSLQEAVADFPFASAHIKFPHGEYGPWALLEHIRLTQNDILEFILDKNYKERQWPNDYWPPANKVPTKKDWQQTISSYEKDLKALQKIAQDPKTDLFAKIPWGDGQTIMREILVVGDHNAYHIGEFAIMRQVMGRWPKNHK